MWQCSCIIQGEWSGIICGKEEEGPAEKKDQKGKRVRVGGYDYPQTENLKGSRRRSSDLQTASQKSVYL